MQNVIPSPSTLSIRGMPTRADWLAIHDVHTEFVDAGIGCCWFARRGDGETVSGETETEAIARLVARNTGLESLFDGPPKLIDRVE